MRPLVSGGFFKRQLSDNSFVPGPEFEKNKRKPKRPLKPLTADNYKGKTTIQIHILLI